MQQAIAMAMLMMIAVGSGEPRVGGRSATEEFSDSKLSHLANAACAGNASEIAQALSDGANPNGRGKEGDTLLFWALKCESLAGMEALLKAGANPNYQIPGDFSATYASATMFNPAPLKLLLRYGGDPNASRADAPGKTALSQALELGVGGRGWDNYYTLLDAGANINKADEVGGTIASEAAALGAYDKVEELLQRGFDYDLVYLGRTVGLRKLDGTESPQAVAQARVIQILKSKGVQFPVPPLVELYSGRARMDKDGTLFVLWTGGYPKDGSPRIEAREQIIKPGELSYKAILDRVGGLKPLYAKGIPRRPEDPTFFRLKK